MINFQNLKRFYHFSSIERCQYIICCIFLKFLILEKMSPETCAAHRQLGMKMENVITLSSIDQFSKFKKDFIIFHHLKGGSAEFAAYS